MKKHSKSCIKEFYSPSLIKIGTTFLTAAFLNWIIVKTINFSLDKFDNLFGNVFLLIMVVIFIFAAYSFACFLAYLYNKIIGKQ